jgi:hypothetical protein
MQDAPLEPVVQDAEPEPVKSEITSTVVDTTPASSTDHLEEVDKW